TTQLPLLDTSVSRIWFKDSSVIFEVKIITIETIHSKITTEKISFKPFKFTYLDLRTMKCQDYITLTDTSSPITNYVLTSEGGDFWEFYLPKKADDTLGIRTVLPDTIINKKSYKRLKIAAADTVEHEYYIECNAKQNIFHLNRTLDEMYPGCKIVKSIEKRKNIPFTYIIEVNVLSDSLTMNEESIFSKWAKNASECKLPLLDFRSASSIMMKIYSKQHQPN
ncbi:MAG: hypothetical protein JST02_08580, partial [Bacteroidetes bacterium]|nr:hypothetical protein [Bacteroidota bacterium]